MRHGASAQLAALADEYRVLMERARSLVTSVGTERLKLRPGPRRWSAAQCLTHLTLTTQAYLPLWRDAYKEAHARRLVSGGEPLRMDLWGRLLVWFIEPPPKMRFPTSSAFELSEDVDSGEVLPAFLGSQEQLLSALLEGEGLALDRVKIKSPFARQVKYSVWSSFCIVAAHQRRHLLQAERAACVVFAPLLFR